MREILFKAKRLDNGEWVQGDLLKTKYEEIVYICHEDSVFRCDGKTVCQYTGLRDSKGKKVFEGDVLRLSDEASITEWEGVITFGNPNSTYTWGWQIIHVSGDDANTDTLLWFDMEDGGAYCVVIGNIHDKEAQECSV